MKIAVSSDGANEMTAALIAELKKRGHSVQLFGPIAPGDAESDWPVVSSKVGHAVSEGSADEGIVCCWTGTGASIAANKIHGVRAALVEDAATARMARIFNHANVLALSLRKVSVPLMQEIIEAWFAQPVDSGEAQTDWNRQQVARIKELETRGTAS